MDWSVTYVISQIFTILTYIFLALTYYAKDRRKLLLLSFLSLSANMMAYSLLNAWTGIAMCIVALIRNIIFMIDENKNGKREIITKIDIFILIFLFMISIILAIFTYNGFFSLLSVFATLLYTFSVWQKKTSFYKLLGIPVEILWLLYNIYIMSIFGIIAETILLICTVTGYWLEVRKSKKM